MSFRNTSRLSNSMDPDYAQHFWPDLGLAVEKVYQQNSFNKAIWCSLSLVYMYIPDSLFLVNFLICLNFRPKLLLTSVVCWLPSQTIWTQVRPDKHRAWSGSRLLDTLLIFPKDFLEKKRNNIQTNFEKKISRRQNHDNLPRRQKESMNWNGRCCKYMHVSCLSLIFVCFHYGTSILQLCVCVCVCVSVSKWWRVMFVDEIFAESANIDIPVD